MASWLCVRGLVRVLCLRVSVSVTLTLPAGGICLGLLLLLLPLPHLPDGPLVVLTHHLPVFLRPLQLLLGC